MITGGIAKYSVSVGDMAQALSFYRDTIGLKVVAEGEIEPDVLRKLWGLPANFRGKSVCLRNPVQTTAIELVALEPRPSVAIRENAPVSDYGLLDMAFYVASTRRVQETLEKQGRKWFTPPYHYPPFPSGSDVIEGFAYGPSSEIVAIIEYVKPLRPAEQRLPGDFWALCDMAQTVGSMDEANRFYQKALGLALVLETNAAPGFFDEILHFPPKTKALVRMFNSPNCNNPVVEALAPVLPGKPLEHTPAKKGIFLISFESDNLQGELAAIEKNGFKVLAGPLTCKSSLYGKVKIASIEGPSKIRVEIFQKI